VLVRVTDPEREPPRKEPVSEPPIGIPELVLCSRQGGEGLKSWEEINEGGVEMDYETVVFPFVDEDKLSWIYVNLDSKVRSARGGVASQIRNVRRSRRGHFAAGESG
jgi:hypothetical protein